MENIFWIKLFKSNQNSVRHDSVISQLPVDADVLRIWQCRWLATVLRRRIWSSSNDEQITSCGHQIAVEHFVNKGPEIFNLS